ncbi:MAG: GDP-mannose 4,6-dehydratase, partial [Actinobacteria bacterium]|nr:GDP-mannose 4,6-dehydratase [Actinomycetota bacterium]
MDLSGARAVVTGGAGFLGSHLCDRLLQAGAEVVAIDNLITGREGNLDHLIGRDRFTFINYDVTNYLHVPGEVDHILHFASPASPIDYLELPIQTLKVGALGTHKALGLARAKGARFMLASTSEVYGDPEVNPQPETYWGNVNPIGPRGVYDEAKRFAEAMTYAYHNYHGVDVRVARIFNSIMADEQVLFDDGHQLRREKVGELASRIGANADEHVTPDRVGVLTLDQRADQLDDAPDRLRGQRLVIGTAQAEGVGVGDVGGGHVARQVGAGHTEAPCGVVDLVVDVGDVGHERDRISLPAQEAHQQREGDERPRVADVDAPVHGGPARVDAHAPSLSGTQLAHPAGGGVVQAD